jgi:hypothetical protein
MVMVEYRVAIKDKELLESVHWHAMAIFTTYREAKSRYDRDSKTASPKRKYAIIEVDTKTTKWKIIERSDYTKKQVPVKKRELIQH